MAPRIPFLGRVLESTKDAFEAGSEFLGPHHVLFPTSRQDVAAALRLVKDRTVHVRSGRQVSAADKKDATGGVVLDLEALSSVRVGAESVVAEAAATAQRVAETLAETGRALPIPDVPERSMAGSLLRGESSLLTRTLGPLQDFVVSVQGLTPDGNPLSRRDGGLGGAAVIKRIREAKGVMTDIKLRTVDAAPLWLLRHTFAYTGPADLATLARSLFLRDDRPQQMDCAVDGFTGPYGVPMVTISIAGKTAPHRELAEDMIRRAVVHLPEGCVADESRHECRGAEVLRVLGESVRGALSTLGTETFGFLADQESDWADLVDRFARDVERGLANPESLKLSSRLRLSALDKLEVSGLATAKEAAESVARSFVDTLSSPGILSPPAPLTRSTGRIPNFDGDVIVPQDGARYQEARHQYANSSYPAERTSPFMVAYPLDPADVGAAVLFAKNQGKRVVARSGGHQYSGKSSGGDDTIVLSLDRLAKLDATVDPVKVGPAVRLQDLAAAFARHGVTIPHGECPQVAIGGHAQTGGYGHLARAFGLAMDYVESFDIVLGDGTQRTVERPKAGTSADNDALFAAVLSGNAGSFGIVTEYRFNVIRDSDAPDSYVYVAARWYRKSLFRQLMEQAQHWTRLHVQGNLPDGIDFMMTARSRDVWVIPPLILVELVGRPDRDDDAKELLKNIVDVSKSNGFRLRHREGHKPLSKISHMFVRDGIEITRDGREFKEPYEKRVNCTKQALSDDFVREFTDIIDDVIGAWPGVKLIFQMLIGGGAAKRNGETGHTAIPHRDLVYKFVFDLFYKDGSRHTARAFQTRMQGLIERHFNHGRENRVFWGSFGDTNMADDTIRDMYYDDPAQYARLQQVKRDVDPDNVFRTEFTVQP